MTFGRWLVEALESSFGRFEGLDCRVSDFMYRNVVHRRDDAVCGWRSWINEDPLVHPCKVPPALSFSLSLTLLAGFGVLDDPDRIDEEFRKAWLPFFCRSGKREASLEEFDAEVDGWLPLLHEMSLVRILLKSSVVKVLLLVVWMVGDGGE